MKRAAARLWRHATHCQRAGHRRRATLYRSLVPVLARDLRHDALKGYMLLLAALAVLCFVNAGLSWLLPSLGFPLP